MKLRFLPLLTIAALGVTTAGCGKEVVRGSNDPSIDAHALSTGLDKDDIQRALHETLNNLRAAPIMNEWRSTNPPPNVAIFPFQNNTSEHIDPQLQAILGEAETWLVEANVVKMINRDMQNQMIKEVEGAQHPVFNPAHIPQYGKQLGVKYYLTGKVSATDERTEGSRRVQYFFFMQVVEVESSAILWQHKAYTTKALK